MEVNVIIVGPKIVLFAPTMGGIVLHVNQDIVIFFPFF